MRGISSVASRNNPIKYTNPDGREVDDFENNKGFSLSSLDLTNKEIQKDSELNKYNTPLPLVALDKISSYAKECASVLKNVKNLSNALFILGIGIGVEGLAAGKAVDWFFDAKGW